MIADFVNEELLAREAAEMGLGEGDTVVRRRLAQKLGFLIEDTSRLVDPSDEDLRQYHEANASRFQTPARISFAQIYFNPDKRKNAVSDATSTLELLAEGGGTPPQDLGDRLLVEGAFNDLDEQAVSNLFGADFAEAVLALEPGAWNGPIESGFGVHLVSVTEKTAATLPPLAEVREEVRSEWLRDQQAAATEAYLARLREKYGVIVEESVEPLLSGDTVGSLVSR